VTSRDFERTGAGSVGGFLVDAAYNASGLNDQVKKLLPKNDLLKDATVRVTSAYSELSGNIEPIAQFESKLHWDELKLRGQASLVSGRGRRAQAEYRFSDSVSGVVQVDSDNPSVPSADYGVDLKWHTESP
jgi:translocation and assembly module TamB